MMVVLVGMKMSMIALRASQYGTRETTQCVYFSGTKTINPILCASPGVDLGKSSDAQRRRVGRHVKAITSAVMLITINVLDSPGLRFSWPNVCSWLHASMLSL